MFVERHIRKRIATIGLSGALLVGGIVGGGAVVTAVTPAFGETAPEVGNTVTLGTKTYVTERAVDVSWRVATTQFPAALPEGVNWPEVAPAFFDATGNDVALFEPNTFSVIAATYWRCSWLRSKLEAADADDTRQSSEADAALERYSSLPGVRSDLESYLAYVHETAKGLQVTPDQFEFDSDCSILTEEGDVQ